MRYAYCALRHCQIPSHDGKGSLTSSRHMPVTGKARQPWGKFFRQAWRHDDEDDRDTCHRKQFALRPFRPGLCAGDLDETLKNTVSAW